MKKQAILTASLAGVVAAIGLAGLGQQAQAVDDAGKVPCYGINKCKGVGECSGKGHSCSGQNGCGGQGMIKLNKETCLKIKGGSLTPEPSAS